ncbi:MAG: hypothetical protein AAF587_01330 [Bacteroidota bacterium]
MKETDHFESLIRSKLAEKPFPYDEAYWTKAQAQFAVWDRKKKRRILLFWIFTFGLFASGVGGWWMLREGETQAPPYVDLMPVDTCESIPHIPTPGPRATLSSLSQSASARSDDKDEFGGKPPTSHWYLARAAKSAPFSSDQAPLPAAISSVEMDEDKQKNKAIPIIQEPRLSHPVFSVNTIQKFRQSDWDLVDQTPGFVELSPNQRRLRPYVQVGLLFSPAQLADLSSQTIETSNTEVEVGISLPIRSRMTVKTGVSYYSFHPTQAHADLEFVEYDFIFRSQQLRWTPERLHYLGLGAGLNVRVLPKHSLGGFLRLGHLLTTKGSLVESFQTSFESASSEAETVRHYRNGLPDWDGQIRLVYQYQLARKWSLQLAGQYGLRNLTKDELFSQDKKNRNSGGSLSLTYWLR